MGGRFSRLQDSLEGGDLGEEPPLALHLEQQQLASLSHLERAAVLTTFAALQRVEADSRTLLACLRAIKEPPHKHKSVLPPESVAPECKRRVDADSLLALFRGMLSVWLGSLIWIFVDPPGHLAFVVFVGLFTLMTRYPLVRSIAAATTGMLARKPERNPMAASNTRDVSRRWSPKAA